MLYEVLAPLLKRDADDLRDRLRIGPAGKCAELLSRYAEAGCQRVHLWPLGDEPQRIELAATAVLPAREARARVRPRIRAPAGAGMIGR